MNKKYSQKQVASILQSKGYIIYGDYKSYKEKIRIKDDDGYLYSKSLGDILSGKTPERFSCSNPFTIKNIEHYIDENNIEAHLLSEHFIRATAILSWKCRCGDLFQCSWNSFKNGRHLCKRCSLKSKGLKQRIDKNYVVNKIVNMGYRIDSINVEACVFDNVKISDDLGYKYYPVINNILYDKRPLKFHKANIFTIENINNYFTLIGASDYACISDKYVNNISDLKILHKSCGTIFDAKLNEIINNDCCKYKKCPKCKRFKTESIHASVLKQVFVHNYPDTVLEDKTCVNSKTGRTLPTDIVNHRLKLAIEIQSSYHDNRKSIDLYKREFWINKGYHFYSPDIRDYTVLEMIQLFFEHITFIPDYIDYSFSNCVDFLEIQKMIDAGHTINEISLIKNISTSTIRGLITDKKVTLPSDYKNRVFKIKPIIRLDTDGNIIKKYETLNSISRDGFATGTIRRVLNGKQSLSYGTKWVYEI